MPIPTSFSDETPSHLNTEPNLTGDSSNPASARSQASTQTKTEAELEADRLYEERIEEEYAKREGGA